MPFLGTDVCLKRKLQRKFSGIRRLQGSFSLIRHSTMQCRKSLHKNLNRYFVIHLCKPKLNWWGLLARGVYQRNHCAVASWADSQPGSNYLFCIELYCLRLKSVMHKTSSHIFLLLEKAGSPGALHRSEVVLEWAAQSCMWPDGPSSFLWGCLL